MLFSFSALSLEGVYKVIVEKQQKKVQNRFSILEYLATKKKIALMDQWLALNSESSSWFELEANYLTGDLTEAYNTASTETENTYKRYEGSLFIKFLGFTAGKEEFSDLSESDFYQGNLLLLGNSIQGSNITLHGGQRSYSLDDLTEFKQNYYGGSLTLYLLNFIGVKGMVRKLAKETSENTLAQIEGERFEYTGFLDLYLVRLQATYFKEVSDLIVDESLSTLTNSGVIFGGSLFF